MASIRPMTTEEIPQVECLIDTASEAWLKRTRATAPEYVGSRLVRNRFHKEPAGCFVAVDPAQGLVGSVLSITWGSVAWLGPLAVHPAFEGQGVEQELIGAVLRHWEPITLLAQGVETLPNSPAQIELYAGFGFRPQFLTATFVGAVDPAGPREPVRQRTPQFELIRLSQLTEAVEETMLGQCRRIADRHYPGLDYHKELQSVKEHLLGDTLLLAVGERLYGFAICHTSETSEADPQGCYIKALLIDPAIDDQETLLALIEGCEGYARMQKLATVRIGVNLACWEGYRAIAERGYQMQRLRLRMVRPVGELLSDPSPFHFNDWR
jgi:GNAT superfamily N-acetyltransferase